MNYFCCDEFRRNEVKHHPTLNGIDFLEVIDIPSDPYILRQTTLKVHFIKDLVPGNLNQQNVIIEGGERIQNISVVNVSVEVEESPPLSPPDDDHNKILVIQVKEAGDFSKYTLRLITDDEHKETPDGFDPILSSVEFSFKVLCPSEFDCKPQHNCEKEIAPAPEINYLAKDYASFRQLMLDRMTLLTPQWKERHPADVGVMMVELLAYVGDYLSYQQDAVATEAYLGTARKRISVRRHARLVDYFMHDGSNARTWAHIDVAEIISGLNLTRQSNNETTKFLTRINKLPDSFRADSDAFRNAIMQDIQVFEMLHDITLYAAHNKMQFYTWRQRQCCLPTGATSATLNGDFPDLKAGDVLIFIELLGPQTGKAGDADPMHRHPVQLTRVTYAVDPLGDPAGSPPDPNPKKLTEIIWHEDDALPFPVCISSIDEKGETIIVSAALGNNVLVDHGSTSQEKLQPVPKAEAGGASNLSIIRPSTAPCEKGEEIQFPVRYRPKLKQGPITQGVEYDAEKKPVSAFAVRQWSVTGLSPRIILTEDGEVGKWEPQRDLLNSNHNDKHFAAEIEADGNTFLRFGNDTEGQRPAPGTEFTATYRLGNGIAGNIGANSLAHLVSNDPGITGANDKIKKVWNPLAATGGTNPEDIELVRQKAPNAFRRQERAVTLADYEEVSKRCKLKIQRSAASLRWTGSWRTVFLTVDRIAGLPVGEDFENRLRSCIEKYRMAGQDLEVDSPQFVSLEVEMIICVKKNYFNSDVKAALLEVFSNRKLSNGKTGIFHPDNFSFGQPVYLSGLYAAAQKVQGVELVRITAFQRQGKNSSEAMDTGKLLIGRLEIARLDNDRNFPEHGVFNLIMKGGK
ncbi:MAG: putative baseplate assembly protein [Ginsengibacter sp.]